MVERSAAEIVANALTIALGFGVLPVWLLMGFADYFCHRTSRIECTSGARESVFHLIQFTCTGLPLLAVLFFRVDAGLLLLLTFFVILHHTVAYLDIRYANATRYVSPIEQMVHSFLEVIPVAALLLVSILNIAQAGALFSGGADFGVHVRVPPLPAWYMAAILGSAVAFGFLPYLEELARCLRYRARARLFIENR